MPMVAGVLFRDQAIIELRDLVPDDERWPGFAVAIAHMLVRDRAQGARLEATPPPDWPALKLDRWPARSIWVTEFVGRYSVAFELTDPITVHTIFESPRPA